VSWHKDLNLLRDTLAEVYPTESIARTIVSEAGVSEKFIDFDGSAIEFWKNILSQAHDNNQVQNIINVAKQQYPQNIDLLEAEKTYHGRKASDLAKPIIYTKRKIFIKYRIFIIFVLCIVGVTSAFLYWRHVESTSDICRTGVAENGRIRVLASHVEHDQIRWWVGQDGQGLRTFTCPQTNCTKETLSPANLFLQSERVLTLAWDKAAPEPSNIWVSTAEGTLTKLSWTEGQWRQTTAIKQNYCPANAIIVEKDELYLGPIDSMQPYLYKLDKQQQWSILGRLNIVDEQLRFKVRSLVSNDAQNGIWAATDLGLYRVHADSSSSPLKPPELDSQYMPISDAALDSSGLVWVGTSRNGLFIFDPIINQWTQITELPSLNITGVSLLSSNNTAIIGTDNGIAICTWKEISSNARCNLSENPYRGQKIELVNLSSNGIAAVSVAESFDLYHMLLPLHSMIDHVNINTLHKQKE